jgi:putative molybdopterin biosynthesis protein
MTSGVRLRLARQARGFSQQQLARMAGVSRQAVSAVEAGQSDPSLRVALALAQALGLTVEDLFGGEEMVSAVPARFLGRTAPAGARVTLAQVGDSFVALPLSGVTASRAGFRPAGGLIRPAGDASSGADQDPRAMPGLGMAPGTEPDDEDLGVITAVSPIAPPRPTLVVAGCDPALPLLAEPLSLLDPPVMFSWWPCSSREALRLAAAGLVHVAGAHLSDPSGAYNTGAAAQWSRAGGEVFGFAAWREGLLFEAGAGAATTATAGGGKAGTGIAGVGDIAERGLRLVNREPGAEARRVLDRELASIGVDGRGLPGYHSRATGHLQVADAIAAGLADAGVASEPAALAYGLGFVPLAAERFDLVIPAAQVTSREVQALLKVLGSRWLLDQLNSLPGYDAASCGQHVATLPSRSR